MSTRHCLVPTLGSQLLSCSMLVQLLTNWLKLINFRLKKKRNGKKNNHYSIYKIQERYIIIHLKNVVEPPDPYSSTSMSGLKAEHINSTPHRSNITVLGEKRLNQGWVRRYGSFKQYSENNGPCFQQSEKGFNYHYFNFQNSDYILCMDNI